MIGVMRSPALAVLVALHALPPALAHADDAPLLVVVEASPHAAAAIREQIGRTLSRPVVSLLDEAAPRAIESISVAVSSDGRSARLCYRTTHGAEFRDAAAPAGAREPSWVAEVAVQLLRESRRAGWVLVPTEILDPFGDVATQATRIPTEVIDPWERNRGAAAREPASLLGRPRPR